MSRNDSPSPSDLQVIDRVRELAPHVAAKRTRLEDLRAQGYLRSPGDGFGSRGIGDYSRDEIEDAARLLIRIDERNESTAEAVLQLFVDGRNPQELYLRLAYADGFHRLRRRIEEAGGTHEPDAQAEFFARKVVARRDYGTSIERFKRGTKRFRDALPDKDRTNLAQRLHAARETAFMNLFLMGWNGDYFTSEGASLAAASLGGRRGESRFALTAPLDETDTVRMLDILGYINFQALEYVAQNAPIELLEAGRDVAEEFPLFRLIARIVPKGRSRDEIRPYLALAVVGLHQYLVDVGWLEHAHPYELQLQGENR